MRKIIGVWLLRMSSSVHAKTPSGHSMLAGADRGRSSLRGAVRSRKFSCVFCWGAFLCRVRPSMWRPWTITAQGGGIAQPRKRRDDVERRQDLGERNGTIFGSAQVRNARLPAEMPHDPRGWLAHSGSGSVRD